MKKNKGCAIALTAGIVFIFALLFLLYFGGLGVALTTLLPGGLGLLIGFGLIVVCALIVGMLVSVGISRAKEIEEENEDDYRNY